MILDAFSFFDNAHPALSDGEICYLVAPGELTAAQLSSLILPRVLGGLLPVMSLDRPTFDAQIPLPFWRGLLLAPPSANANLTDEETLARLASAPHLPIVVDCGIEGFSRPDDLEALLKALPPRPVVLTHGGQLNISGQHLEAARALFVEYPHTWLETSGIYRQDFLEDLFGAIGYERILYGSGHPRMHEGLELERVRLLQGGPATQAAMLGGNAARLFGLDSES